MLLHPPQYGPWNLPWGLLVQKTTCAPMIYTALCIMFGCIHIHYLGKWEGVGPWNSRVFWAPNDTLLSARYHFTGSKKLSNSRAQPPPRKMNQSINQKWIQPPACSDHGLYIIPLLPIGWRPFMWWKNLPKDCTILVWMAGCWNSSLTSCNTMNSWWLSRIFGVRFGGKDHGLSTSKPWSE
jgi:hypothetical protein